MPRFNLKLIELGFDEMQSSTQLAKDYTQEHGDVFRSILPDTFISTTETTEYTDKANHKIIETDCSDFELSLINRKQLVEVCLKIKKLVEIIEQKTDLIAELEYLIRDVPKHDTINVDLKLMIQNLQYLTLVEDFKHFDSCVVVMENTTPLFLLGSIGQVLLTHDTAVIHAEPEAAAVCTLFTELCHSVGLDKVYLEIRNNAYELTNHGICNTINIRGVHQLNDGVCVVTEKCDLDSAVDGLVSSSTWYPWRLKYVLVQESVFEQFRSILSFKANLKNEQYNLDPAEEAKLRTKSAELILLNKKAFIINFVGYINECKTEPCQAIHITAYRTNKELISIKDIKYPYHFISLWCNDVSEINEIIYHLNPIATWVNGYNQFQGPNIASQAIYSSIERQKSVDFLAPNVYNYLKQIQEKWLKHNVEKRRQIICNAVDVMRGKGDSSVYINEEVLPLIKETIRWQPNFIEYSDNSVCFGKLEPVGFVKLKGHRCNYQSVVNSIVHGNVVLIEKNPKDDDVLMQSSDEELNLEFEDALIVYEGLAKRGAPIVILDHVNDNGFDPIHVNNTLYKTKVVYQNFGTMFAY